MSNKIIDLLSFHLKKYPKMEYIDIIKLVYQSTFGGAHLLYDASLFRLNLIKEYDSIEKNEKEEPFVNIGETYSRINLKAIKNKSDLDIVIDYVCKSNQNNTSNLDDFKQNLKLAQDYLQNDEFNVFIEEYLSKKEYIVSHSKTYRQLYDPHYRIISNRLLEELKEKIF